MALFVDDIAIIFNVQYYFFWIDMLFNNTHNEMIVYAWIFILCEILIDILDLCHMQKSDIFMSEHFYVHCKSKVQVFI